MKPDSKMEKLLKHHKTHWQWYKTFFNITILKYLVTWFALVPIALKIVESFKPSLKVNETIVFYLFENPHLPFGLKMLWLSSLSFVIGLLLYQFFCPSFVKTYSSFADYLKHLHSPRWIIWESLKVINDKNEIEKFFLRLSTKEYLKESEKIIEKNEVLVEKNQTVAYFTYKEKTYTLALPIIGTNNEPDKAKTDIAEKEIFWEIFGRLSSSKKYIRLTILILLLISAILFSYTLIEHICEGLKFIV